MADERQDILNQIAELVGRLERLGVAPPPNVPPAAPQVPDPRVPGNTFQVGDHVIIKTPNYKGQTGVITRPRNGEFWYIRLDRVFYPGSQRQREIYRKYNGIGLTDARRNQAQ